MAVQRPKDRFGDESRSAALGRWLRHAGRHLTRRPALQALLMAGVAGVAVVLAGTSSAVGQAALVVIGVLVTFVLLPETPFRLWNVTADSLAATVPGPKLLDASREIAKAVALQAAGPVGDDAVARIWDSALDGIAGLVNDPAKVTFDLDYQITVTPEGDGPPVVSTNITAKRCFPDIPNSRVWFSYCSDLKGLNHEFGETGQGCLGREVIDRYPGETIDSWERRVGSYTVNLVIDGHDAPRIGMAPEVISGDGWRVVRRVFEPGPLAERFVTTELTAEFRGSPAQRTFPVKFASYSVLGPTQVTFEVVDRDVVTDCDEYISASSRDVVVQNFSGMRGTGVRIRASAGTVLPPGAGAVFTWREKLTSLLHDPPPLLIEHVPEGDPIGPTAPLPATRARCAANDEPLVDVIGVGLVDAYASLGILPARPLRLRAGVLTRLHQAQRLLPEGFGVTVLDAWRTLDEQTQLIDHYGKFGPTRGYVGSIAHDAMRPPHTTGGAIDLTLSWQGTPLALGTDFDSFTEEAHLHAFEENSQLVRRLRRLLASAMTAAGFAPYELEWWHWSFGDDVWSVDHGGEALYDIVDAAPHA